MATFKDHMALDNNIFFNTDEFATLHNIGEREFSVVVDDDRLSERTQKDYEGIYVGDLLFFVNALTFGAKPKPETIIMFDGKPYTVFDAKEDNGMYEIVLKASEN